MRRLPSLVSFAFALGVGIGTGLALPGAAEAASLSIGAMISVPPNERPTFQVTPDAPLEDLTISLTGSDGRALEIRSGPLASGRSRIFRLPAFAARRYRYSGVARFRAQGATETQPLELVYERLNPHPPGSGLTEFELLHDEVQFLDAAAEIPAEEVDKLRRTLNRIRSRLAAYREEFPTMTLYLVGHTASTGSDPGNWRLSAARARAIGLWFRRQGLPLPIFFTGIGAESEDGSVPLETEKVDYVLATQPPDITLPHHAPPRFVAIP